MKRLPHLLAVGLVTAASVASVAVPASASPRPRLTKAQWGKIQNGTIDQKLIRQYPIISETFIAHDLQTSGSAPWACFGNIFLAYVSASPGNAAQFATSAENVYLESSGWSQAMSKATSVAFVDSIEAFIPFTVSGVEVVKAAQYGIGALSAKAAGYGATQVATDLSTAYLANVLESHMGGAMVRAAIAAGQNQYSTLSLDFVVPLAQTPQYYTQIASCGLPGVIG